MNRLLCILFVVSALGVAGYAAVVYGLMPLGALVHPEMRASFELRPVGIYTHIFASVLALALGPFQMSTALRRRYPRWHRGAGKVYLGGVLLGGLAGFYMAFSAYGGWVSTFGFGGLAIAWLATGGMALVAIRRGDVATHRRFMVRNVALTFAAVTLRAYLGLGVATGLPFSLYYPVISWLCWVPNVVFAELWLWRYPAPPDLAGPTTVAAESGPVPMAAR